MVTCPKGGRVAENGRRLAGGGVDICHTFNFYAENILACGQQMRTALKIRAEEYIRFGFILNLALYIRLNCLYILTLYS